MVNAFKVYIQNDVPVGGSFQSALPDGLSDSDIGSVGAMLALAGGNSYPVAVQSLNGVLTIANPAPFVIKAGTAAWLNLVDRSAEDGLRDGFVPSSYTYDGVIEAILQAVASPTCKTVLFEDATYNLGGSSIPIISGLSYVGVQPRFECVNGGWTDKEPNIVGGTRFVSTADYVFWDGATNQNSVTAIITPQNVTFTSGSSWLAVESGAEFSVGRRIYFKENRCGFYRGIAYIVKNVNGNNIQAGFAGMAPLNANSSGTLVGGVSAGYPNDISAGVTMRNLAGVGVKTFIKAGAKNTFSFMYSHLHNIYATGVVGSRGTFNAKRLIDVINYAQCDFHSIFTYDGDGQYWGSDYPVTHFTPGNSRFDHIFNANNGAASSARYQHGIVFETTIGSQINQNVCTSLQNNSPYDTETSITTGSQVSGGVSISVPDSTAFPIGMPVYVAADVNGFRDEDTYFVTASASNVIELSLWKGGTSKVLTGTSAMTLKYYGFPQFEFVGLGNLGESSVTFSNFIGLDVEGTASVKVLVQNGNGLDVVLNTCSSSGSHFGICGRGYSGTLNTKTPIETEWEGDCRVIMQGQRSAVNPGPYVGGPGLFWDATNLVYGLSIHNTGNPYLAAFQGISTASGNWTKANYPISVRQAETNGARTFGSSFDAYRWVFNGAAGVTWTLPTITNATPATSMVGMAWEFVNASANTLTIATNGTQTLNNQAGKTSFVLPAGASVKCTGGKTSAGTLFWIAEYTPALP